MKVELAYGGYNNLFSDKNPWHTRLPTLLHVGLCHFVTWKIKLFLC